jgi:hypothetical protein
MATEPVVIFHSRIPQAIAQAKAAIFEATKQVFELDIKPAAVEASPVTPEGAVINEAMGKKPPYILGTGHNRRSIDIMVVDSSEGPRAELFTQSGYGGYLETGTSRMRAQPYLFPSFIAHVDKIPMQAKVIIQGLGEVGPGKS